MNLYVIRDEVAEDVGPIFEAKNDEVAKRNYYALIRKNDVYWEEYTLYRIGSIDRDNIAITANEQPVRIPLSVEWLEAQSKRAPIREVV